jgi:hypothetical protein
MAAKRPPILVGFAIAAIGRPLCDRIADVRISKLEWPKWGIVTLIKYGPILILLGEAKSLKMHMATNGNLPRFRSKTD